MQQLTGFTAYTGTIADTATDAAKIIAKPIPNVTSFGCAVMVFFIFSFNVLNIDLARRKIV
jgi:hypothetical protein